MLYNDNEFSITSRGSDLNFNRTVRSSSLAGRFGLVMMPLTLEVSLSIKTDHLGLALIGSLKCDTICMLALFLWVLQVRPIPRDCGFYIFARNPKACYLKLTTLFIPHVF